MQGPAEEKGPAGAVAPAGRKMGRREGVRHTLEGPRPFWVGREGGCQCR